MNNNTYQKINLDVLPACEICANNDGIYKQAEFIAAQSVNKGDSISWVCICRGHKTGWNEGGDWDAPIFRIAQQSVVGELNHVQDCPQLLRAALENAQISELGRAEEAAFDEGMEQARQDRDGALQEAIGDALDELEAIPLDDEPETGKDRIIEAIRKLRAAL